MDALQEQLQTIVDGHIDFEGQKLAEYLTTSILVFFAVVGFIAGFSLQDARYTLYIGVGGIGLAFLAVVPPWPIYNSHPVKFLKVEDSATAVGSGGIVIVGEEDGKKK